MATEVTNNEPQRDDVQDAAGSGVQSSDSEVTNNEPQRDDVQDAVGSGVQSSDSEVTNNEPQRNDVQDAAVGGVQSSDSEVTEKRSDLIWDDEAHGLCIRVYGDGSKSFIFVYRIEDRQRFIRIGRSPRWSLGGARTRAKELRSIIDQGRDPAGEKLEDSKIAPVENLIRYIAEQMKPDAPEEIQENVSRADNNSGRAVSELEDQTAGETKSLTSLSSRLRKITAFVTRT
jgi:Arm DNA-binding domain